MDSNLAEDFWKGRVLIDALVRVESVGPAAHLCIKVDHVQIEQNPLNSIARMRSFTFRFYGHCLHVVVLCVIKIGMGM